MRKQITCQVCHIQFKPKSGHLKQKTCSKKCGYKLRSLNPSQKKGKHYPHLQRARIGTCKVCGGEYRAVSDFKDRKQKYCSKKCWSNRGETTYKKKCPYCETEFSTTIRKQKYCSKKCSLTIHIGSNSHFWKGGKTPINKLLRTRKAFRAWRTLVFERDDYTCQKCGDRCRKNHRVEIHPHHILPLAEYPYLVYEVNNGMTLCKECHQTIHKNIKLTGMKAVLIPKRRRGS